MGLNPVADLLKRADRTLASANDTLGTVGVTLTDVDRTLAEVKALLEELNDKVVLIDQIPEILELLRKR
jgi:ABC-type transporter Mla subunit MlaD